MHVKYCIIHYKHFALHQTGNSYFVDIYFLTTFISLLTNTMHNSSAEAYGCSASQQIPCLLQNLKGDCHIQRNHALIIVISQTDPSHSHLTSVIPIFIVPYHPFAGLPCGLLPSWFLTRTLNGFRTTHMHATWSIYFIFHHTIILIVYGEEYKSQTSSFSCLHNPVTVSLLGQTVSSAPCIKKSSVHVLPLMRDSKFHTHTKQQQ